MPCSRRRFLFPVQAAFALLALNAASAKATHIDLLVDDRVVEHRYDATSDSYTSAQPFADWNGGNGSALQYSTFSQGSSGIVANLELALWSADGAFGSYAGGDNVFDFTFAITAPQRVSLSIRREYFGAAGLMEVEATLYREGVAILGQAGREDGTALPPSPFGYEQDLALTTVFDRATYRLVVSLYGLGDPGAAGDGAQGYAFVTMDLVPEPGTSVLLAIGLIGLGMRARSQAASSPLASRLGPR